jgi:hypothetical protein
MENNLGPCPDRHMIYKPPNQIAVKAGAGFRVCNVLDQIIQ